MNEAVIHATGEPWHVDERIVQKWFTLMADKMGRPLERVTIKEYLDAFDKANLSDRGLDEALRVAFGGLRFWSDLNVDQIIDRARVAEGRMKREEFKRLPVMDAEQQAKATADQSAREMLMKADEWAEQNPGPAKLCREKVAREFCARFKVDSVKDLSAFAREMYKTHLAMVMLRRAAGISEEEEKRILGEG